MRPLQAATAINAETELSLLGAELGFITYLPFGQLFGYGAAGDAALLFLDTVYVQVNCSNFSPPLFTLAQ